MTTDISERLERFLETERAVLMTGDLGRIDQILLEKRALVEMLGEAAPAPETLAALRSRLQSNTVLYDSALAGIRRVAERLGTLQEMRKSLETYDSHGRRRSIAGPLSTRLEKRA